MSLEPQPPYFCRNRSREGSRQSRACAGARTFPAMTCYGGHQLSRSVTHATLKIVRNIDKVILLWVWYGKMEFPNDVAVTSWCALWCFKSMACRLHTQPFVQGQIKENIKSSSSLAFVRGIHRWQVNSPHKGPVTRKCLHSVTSSWFLLIGFTHNWWPGASFIDIM